MRELLRARTVTSLVWAMHRQPPRQVLLLVLLLLLVVAVADELAGPHYSFSIFYLLVVIAVSATRRRAFVVPMTLLTAATWTAIEAVSLALDDPWLPLLWNLAARFGALYVTAMLVAAVMGMVREEREMSQTDALTGLLNRRGFYDQAEVEVARPEGAARLSVIYLDIDGFKAVNDQRGHAVGDNLLADVAREIERHVRHTDVVARLGGDEFVALLPAADAEVAMAVGRRIAAGLDELCRRRPWPVTFSIGVASAVTAPRSLDHLLSEADRLMYAAKQGGRRPGTSYVVGAAVA